MSCDGTCSTSNKARAGIQVSGHLSNVHATAPAIGRRKGQAQPASILGFLPLARMLRSTMIEATLIVRQPTDVSNDEG